MADFVKKTWACEDAITADELNRMEDGIEEAVECCGGGTPLIANVVDSDPSATTKSPNQSLRSIGEAESSYWLDKTWQEISDAFPNVFVNNPFDPSQVGIVNLKSSVTAVYTTSENGNIYYYVHITNEVGHDIFGTDSTDGYPMYE